jgi:DHA2 family methylenomycin A resistance protein-like MFS transporter
MILRAPQTALIVGLGTMAMAAHSSAMSATVPLMIKQSHLSIAAAQWVIAIYTLALTAFLITAGRVGDAVGLRTVYLGGLLTVIASSGLLVTAGSIVALLLLRAVEGIGAAMISGTSLALLANGCATTDYVRSVGWQTCMTYSGLAAGPLLSGVLVERFHWRAMFIVNIVICSLAYLVGRKLLHPRSGERVQWAEMKVKPLLAPIVVFAPTILILSGKPFAIAKSPVVVWLLMVVAGAALLLGATKLQARLMSVWSGTGTFVGSELLCYLSTFGVAFVAPVYLIQARSFDPVLAGCILSCQHLARAAAAVLAIRATSRLGSSNTRLLGAVIIAVAMLTLSASSDAPGVIVAFELALIGVGTGLFVPANSAEVMAAAPVSHRGAMTGILATSRNLGMTLGVVFAGFVYSHLATTQGREDSFREAVLVLGIFAFLNVIGVARARTQTSFSRATL